MGYSPPYREGEGAFDEAFRDACWRLFSDGRSHITGGRALASSPEGVMQMGSNFRQVCDSAGFDDFVRNVARIDSFASAELRVFLVGTKPVGVDCRLTPPPMGVLSLEEQDRSRVSGSAPFYHYMSSSWLEAERVARTELALSGHFRARGVEASQNAWRLKTLDLETDVWLVDVQTVRRRLDHPSGVVRLWVEGEAQPAEDK